MWAFDGIALALVIDFVYFCRIGVAAVESVFLDGSFIPGSFPQFVGNIHIFFGPAVAFGVICQAWQSEVSRTVILGSSHNVPSDATVGDVVQGRQLSGELERMGLENI